MPEIITNKLNETVQQIATELKGVFIERDEAVDVTLAAVLAKAHVFALGPPGTAKSLILERITQSIEGAKAFRSLVGPFSQPDQIFGPVKISDLQQDKFVRKTTGYLPEAHVGFLDEVYKGNDGILNMCLTLMAERMYEVDGAMVKSPIMSIMGASNELPETQKLQAFHDRFLVRLFIDRIQERAGFLTLLEHGVPETPTKISLADLETAQKEVAAIEVPQDVLGVLAEIHFAAHGEGLQVSDRRTLQSARLAQAMAWLEGRIRVEVADLAVLRHVLWTTPDERIKADEVVTKRTLPQLGEAMSIYGECLKEIKSVDEAQEDEVLSVAPQVMPRLKKAMKRLGELAQLAGSTAERQRIEGLVSRVKDAQANILKVLGVGE